MTSRTSEDRPGAIAGRRFRVHGRVQRVGFRWWTLAQAQRLGITGTVRNRSDGTVEVLARGSEEALHLFATELRNGPEGSDVTAVEEEEAEGVPGSSFEIVR